MNLPKFKAKRADTGEWIYGLVGQSIFGYKPNEIVTTIFSLTPRKDALEHIVFEIIHETLCQFTGLVDKDGVEIYSDDIRTDGIHNKLRIYHVIGGFAIKTPYYMEDISDLHGTDELIMQPISDPQTLAWIIQGKTAAGNYHDIKREEKK